MLRLARLLMDTCSLKGVRAARRSTGGQTPDVNRPPWQRYEPARYKRALSALGLREAAEGRKRIADEQLN